jgi:hypothetical protein
MRLWTIAIATTTLLFGTSLSRADQAGWISRQSADAGAALIAVGSTVRGYCRPCGDKSYRPLAVTSVVVMKADEPSNSYEVRVNGQGIDLAYEYVLSDGHWKNLAMLIGLNVIDVPAELPPTVPAKS